MLEQCAEFLHRLSQRPNIDCVRVTLETAEERPLEVEIQESENAHSKFFIVDLVSGHYPAGEDLKLSSSVLQWLRNHLRRRNLTLVYVHDARVYYTDGTNILLSMRQVLLDRNTPGQPPGVEHVQFGMDEPERGIDMENVVSFDPLDVHEAVYLASNLRLRNKIKQVYSWKTMQTLLTQQRPRSPITRKFFSLDDVRRFPSSNT